MHRQIEKLKSKVPVESLREDCMARLEEHVIASSYAKGDVVFRIGDDDDQAIFLVEGALSLASADGREVGIDAGHPSARFALANLKPRLYEGTVTSDEALIMGLSMGVLERCTAIDQISQDHGPEIQDDFNLDTALLRQPWVVQMLQTKEFILLPIENLIQVIERVEDVPVKAGEVVIEQGAPGEYFYIIAEGRAKITRTTPGGEVKLDEIGPGEPFGESALISDLPRNATVTMLQDGALKRLSRSDFKELLETQYVPWVGPGEARKLVKDGAIPIDVRTEEEVAQYSIPGVKNVPLFMIRVRLRQGRFNPENTYVVFCDSGIRSATAAFILNQNHIPAYVVKGGLGRYGGAR